MVKLPAEAELVIAMNQKVEALQSTSIFLASIPSDACTTNYIGGFPVASLKQHIEWLIAEAEHDYVSLSLIIGAANKADEADPNLNQMQRTLALIGKLLDHGFQAVDLADHGKCVPWPNQDRASILRRIEEAWRRSGELEIAFDFWFDLPKSRR
ncbi:hypothetical protein EJV46_08100 [Roseococcus sp. SYP-B2431]|uniref:hypothetical protein n=1 Tax=Roseococcus sp. SYP-B2431 TaxID=2496640 RepID=UPI001040DC8B|nr:hypothetical protein [Roseococcus sp. SYP-B2431]TCH98537.1 hypothetical protein EJV46_08100 [Roseococcus sp. SYP-B2431]